MEDASYLAPDAPSRRRVTSNFHDDWIWEQRKRHPDSRIVTALIVTNLALDEIAGGAGLLAICDAMTLEEAMRLSDSLDVTCVRTSCAAVTRVNLQFFASRRPLDTGLDALAKALVCTACGGTHVVVRVSTD